VRISNGPTTRYSERRPRPSFCGPA
jgi:hypothetical protein